MAVLIEAFCVVIKVESIRERHPDGFEVFVQGAPKDRICTDGELLSIRFSTPDELVEFIRHVKGKLLTITNSHRTRPYDLAIVEQNLGPLTHCPWLEFFTIGLDQNSTISACALFDQPRVAVDIGTYINESSMNLAVPDGWIYQDSLSQKLGSAFGREGPALWIE